MTDATKFGHDNLAHLLAEHLLEVPRFQRSYSWDEGNVEEYLYDLAQARARGVAYFMGTVVLASPEDGATRRQIVDGQQRLATTAVLLLAVRDLLRIYGKDKQAEETEKRFLRGYVLSADDEVERLILNPKDQESYDALIEGRTDILPVTDSLKVCYCACTKYLAGIAPNAKDYRKLLDITTQLDEQVQVLVAEASDLPEAYVIFETLNDRGADLTTADLLKNFLFSASKDYFQFVEANWTALEADFDRPEDLVKFIRYEYISRNGRTSVRKLYRAIQADIGNTPSAVKKYMQRLMKAQQVYLAIRDPENSFWGDVNVEVRDSLYAYRRFGFEASMPVLIAAFQNWTKSNATRLLVKLAKWSVRAQFVGRIGGGVAEETFSDAALGITDGTASNQTKVHKILARLIPNDSEFKIAFTTYGDVSTARAKYLLAMLEQADDQANSRPERALEWFSRAVTIEHVLAESAKTYSEANAAVVNQLGNLALLEKRLNHQAGSKSFVDKKAIYRQSQFELTKRLAAKRGWKVESIDNRIAELAELACRAWPAN